MADGKRPMREMQKLLRPIVKDHGLELGECCTKGKHNHQYIVNPATGASQYLVYPQTPSDRRGRLNMISVARKLCRKLVDM